MRVQLLPVRLGVILAPVAILGAVVGCGKAEGDTSPGSGHGAGAGGQPLAGGAGGAAGTEPAPPLTACFEAVECDDPELFRGAAPWELLLSAEAIGEGARLIAVDGDAVLVVLADGGSRVVRLDPRELGVPLSEQTQSTWQFPQPQLAGIAVLDVSRSPDPSELFAIGCESSGGCRLYHAPLGPAPTNPVLAEWPNSELPAAFEAAGLVHDLEDYGATSEARICAFGRGLACLEGGTWVTEISGGPGLLLRDVLVGELSLAAGEGGRWWRRDLGEEWVEQSPLPVELDGLGWFQANPVLRGNASLFEVTSSGLRECTLSAGVAAALGPWQVLDGSGRVVALRMVGWCHYGDLELDAPIIDQARSPCFDATNPRVLTERALWGQSTCFTLL